MNGCFPDWNVEEEDYGSFHDVPSTTHNKVFMSADQGPIELVWQDGHVIVQDQKNLRNTPAVTNEQKQPDKPEVASKCGGSSTNPSDFYLDEDETAPWFQYPLEDTNLSKEFCSEPFKSSGMRPVGEIKKLERETPFSSNKSGFVKDDAEGLLQVVTRKSSNKFQPDDQNPMPPHKSSSQHVKISSKAEHTESGSIVNFSHFSRPWKPNSGYSSGCKEVERNAVETKQNSRHGEPSLPQSSKLSGGVVFRGSNQMQEHPEPIIRRITDAKPPSHPIHEPPAEGGEHRKKANERGHRVILRDRATVTSPSAGSGTSAGTGNRANPNAVDHHRKRKGRDDEDQLDWESEETELHSAAEVGKPLQGCTSRRSRAAEVHNLSERRRRDKINEKMKALQELIPHCNKTDKASMLDEAIEYLKALQLQVQMMWMGNGMAPMMFPSAQHYLPFRSTMPVPIPGAFQVPPLVFGNQTMCPTSTPTRFQSSAYSNNTTDQSQNSSIPEAFLRYLMLQNMQQSQEGMKNMFGHPPPCASQQMQPNFSTMPSMSSASPINGPHPLKDNQNE